jgi:hypothetical protein
MDRRPNFMVRFGPLVSSHPRAVPNETTCVDSRDMLLAFVGASLIALALFVLWRLRNRPPTQPIADDVPLDDDARQPAQPVEANRPGLRRADQRRLHEQQLRRDARDATIESRRQRAEAQEALDADRDDRERQRTHTEETTLRELRADAEMQRTAEYEMWRGRLGVVDSGFNVQESDSDHNARILCTILAQVRRERVTHIEALAAQLHETVDVVVKALETLLATGDVLGVFDDRGKFIAVSETELEQLAQLVHTRGRVSSSELARRWEAILI